MPVASHTLSIFSPLQIPIRQSKRARKATYPVEAASSASEAEDEIRIEKVISKKKPLAPIFASCQKSTGPKKALSTTVVELDPEKVAARKAFLMSSVPDALKNRQFQVN